MQHLDEGTVHAWLDGALSPDEAADVERHAAHCDACAALVAEARGMIAGAARIVGALDVVPGGVLPTQRSGAAASRSVWRSLRLTPLRAALAASLMIAAASLMVVRRQEPIAPPPVVPQPVKTQPVVTQQVSPRADAVAAPASSSVADAAAPVPPAPKPAVSSPEQAKRVRRESASSGATQRNVPAGDMVQGQRGQTAARAAAELARSPVPAPRPTPTAPPAALPTTAATAATAGAAVAADSTRAKSLVLTEVVTTGLTVPRDSVGRVQEPGDSEARRMIMHAMLDSVATKAARSSNAVMRSAFADPAAANEVRRYAPIADVRSAEFVGCYRIGLPTDASLEGLPERFALAQSSATVPTRSLVLPVDATGRPDSAIVGTWRPVRQGEVVLTLINAPRRSLVLTSADNGFTAQSAGTQSATKTSGPRARIFRAECRR